MPKIKKSIREIKLESIILDISLMARRYADGRRTYAVPMYNAAIESAVELGLSITPDYAATPPSYFAQDGDTRIARKEMPQ